MSSPVSEPTGAEDVEDVRAITAIMARFHRAFVAGDEGPRAAAFAARTPTPHGDAWPTETPDRTSPDLLCGAAGVGLAFLRVLAPEAVTPAIG